MRRHFYIIFILLFTSTVFAKTLVISDIDDTIRSINRMASYSEQLDNAMDSYRAFGGMSAIYNYFDRSGAEIHYVTATVVPLTDLSEYFLADSQFPQANHFYYKGWLEETEEYKVYTIQSIIDEAMPDTIVLIGDSADRDVSAYKRLAQQNKNVHVFIHKLFEWGGSEPVPHEQHLFLTGADLAVQLEAMGFLKSDEVAYVLAGVYQDLTSANEYKVSLVHPPWAETLPEDIARAFGLLVSPSGANQENLEVIKKILFGSSSSLSLISVNF